MPSPFDVTVTIALGTHEATFGARELAARLGAPDLERRLLELVLGSRPPRSGERGKGGERLPSGPVTLNAFHELLPGVGVQGRDGVRGRETQRPVENVERPVENVERLAGCLASRLGDERSLRYFQLVARVVPREVIRDALDRALDVPRRDVRRSRAALFVSIVRPYVRRPESP